MEIETSFFLPSPWEKHTGLRIDIECGLLLRLDNFRGIPLILDNRSILFL